MWFRQLDTPVQPHNSPIVALFDDGCTAGHFTYIDGEGWCDAEDCFTYEGMLDGLKFWTPAPPFSQYEPRFMYAD